MVRFFSSSYAALGRLTSWHVGDVKLGWCRLVDELPDVGDVLFVGVYKEQPNDVIHCRRFPPFQPAASEVAAVE